MDGMKEIRCRNWTFLYYEEYGKDADKIIDWGNEKGLSLVVSPLHTKDEEGQEIKHHYHCVLLFSGVKSYSAVLGLVQELSENIKIVKKVEDVKNISVYLYHGGKNAKEKLNKEDVKTTDTVDFEKLTLDRSEKKASNLGNVLKMINEKNITSFHQLLDVCNYDTEVLEVCGNCSYFLSIYFKECLKDVCKKALAND